MNSSWIDFTLYKRVGEASYLAIFLKPGHGVRVLNDGGVLARQDVPTALLYGPKVPSWLPGLVAAGTARRSVGLAYNRLVRGKYEYQRIEGESNIRQLKEMMS